MPSLANHQSAESTKLLLIGDSGSGKTGSLASLAAAGYNLRILDLDNGLDVLKNFFRPGGPYPMESLGRIHYRTLTEPMKSFNGTIIPAKATVWPNLTKMLGHWKDEEVDFGPVTTWGPQDVLVIDSLTMAGTAALNFHQAMNGRLGQTGVSNEWRRDIGQAQAYVEQLLQLLYDTSVKCNVIVTAHITYVDDAGASPGLPNEGKPQTGFPSAVGKALSPKIPRYFNTVLMAKTTGFGAGTRHKLYTRSQGVVNCKSTAPLKVAESYDLGSGLAEYFKTVRG